VRFARSSLNLSALKQYLGLGVPVSIQATLTSILVLLDQVMVGQLGELALAATGVAAEITSFFVVPVAAFGAGASAFIVQYWARGHAQKAASILNFTAAAGLTVAVPFLTFLIIHPALGFAPFTADLELIRYGEGYLSLVIASLFFAIPGVVFTVALRGMGITAAPLIAVAVAMTVNLALGWVLIFGHFGAPTLGLLGAGIATFVGRLCEAVILAALYLRQVTRLYSLRSMCAWPPRRLQKKLLEIASPILASQGLWACSEAIYVAVYARMSTDALAAVSATYSLQGVTLGIVSGVSVATAILIGRAIASSDFTGLSAIVKRSIALTIWVTLLLGAIIVSAAHAYVGMFNLSPATANDAAITIIFFGAFLTIKGLNKVLGSGVLAAAGDNTFRLKVETASSWLIGVPFALLGAFVLGWPVWGVYALLTTEEVARMIFCLRRALAKDRRWIRLNLGAEVRA
jgi:putative MATE family efflux protein